MSSRGNFASKIGIVLATAGSSVGLGNIWRFPVETGENGGAAFIIIYLACVIFLGVPMMTAEFIIGRRTHTDIASAYESLSKYFTTSSRDSSIVRSAPCDASRLKNFQFSIFNFQFSFPNLWPLAGYAGMVMEPTARSIMRTASTGMRILDTRSMPLSTPRTMMRWVAIRNATVHSSGSHVDWENEVK